MPEQNEDGSWKTNYGNFAGRGSFHEAAELERKFFQGDDNKSGSIGKSSSSSSSSSIPDLNSFTQSLNDLNNNSSMWNYTKDPSSLPKNRDTVMQEIIDLENQGIDHLNNNEFDKAVEFLNKAIEARNKVIKYNTAVHEFQNEKAYYCLGLAYYGLKDYEKALSFFNKAIANVVTGEKNTYKHLNWRGIVYKNLGNMKAAIADWQKSADIENKLYEKAVELDGVAQADYWYKRLALKNLADNGIQYIPGSGSSSSSVDYDAMADRMIEADDLYDEEKYKKAFAIYKELAEDGFAPAQEMLGQMYEEGEGVFKSKSKSKEWYAKAAEGYRKTAEQGHAVAQEAMGRFYNTGNGVPQDYAKAIEWFKKSAAQGNADAMYGLGNRYFYGEGVPKDIAKAAEWYGKAAEKGNNQAKKMFDVAQRQLKS